MNTKAIALGGGNTAVKMTLSDYGRDDWDAIFGAGSADALDSRAGSRRGRTLTPEQGWTRQAWFRKCADARGKAVQTMPWAIYPEGTEAGDYERAIYSEGDPSAPDEVAPLAGLPTALYLMEVSLSLLGEAYHLKLLTGAGQRVARSRMGRFSGLQWVNPTTIKPILTAQGIAGYKRKLGADAEVILPAETVLPVFQPDPFVELGKGTSDGEAAGMNAAVLDSMAAFLSRYLDGGLIKQTILTVEGTHTKEQANEVSAWWRRFISRGNPSDAKVLSSAVKPHVIGDGLKDLTDATITAEQREAIAAAFGIPYTILASAAANFATAEVEERGFYTRTAIPQAKLIERAINKHLLADYGLALRFEPERMEIFQRFELEKAEQVQKAVGRPVMSVNEGRRLLGLMAVDGGDEIATPQPVPPTLAEGAPPPAPQSGDDADGMDGITKALAGLSSDGFDRLLKMIPEAA